MSNATIQTLNNTGLISGTRADRGGIYVGNRGTIGVLNNTGFIKSIVTSSGVINEINNGSENAKTATIGQGVVVSGRVTTLTNYGTINKDNTYTSAISILRNSSIKEIRNKGVLNASGSGGTAGIFIGANSSSVEKIVNESSGDINGQYAGILVNSNGALTIENSGKIYSNSEGGIEVRNGSAQVNIVQTGGSITGRFNGINLGTGSNHSIDIQGGSVSGFGGSGITTGSGVQLDNVTINGNVSGSNGTAIQNRGTITNGVTLGQNSNTSGNILNEATGSISKVEVEGQTTGTLYNAGTIGSIENSGTNSTNVTNNGNGTIGDISSSNGSINTNNNGTITGNITNSGTGSNNVNNNSTGTIVGDITNTGNGSTTITNNGNVTGGVNNSGTGSTNVTNNGSISSGITIGNNGAGSYTGDGSLGTGSNGSHVTVGNGGSLHMEDFNVGKDGLVLDNNGSLSVSGTISSNQGIGTGGTSIEQAFKGNVGTIDASKADIVASPFLQAVFDVTYNKNDQGRNTSFNLTGFKSESSAGVVASQVLLSTLNARDMLIDNIVDNAAFSSTQSREQRGVNFAFNPTSRYAASTNDFILDPSMNSDDNFHIFALPYYNNTKTDIEGNAFGSGAKTNTLGLIAGGHLFTQTGVYGIYAGYESGDTTADGQISAVTLDSKVLYGGLKYANVLAYMGGNAMPLFVKADTKLAYSITDAEQRLGSTDQVAGVGDINANGTIKSLAYSAKAEIGTQFGSVTSSISPTVGLGYLGAYTPKFDLKAKMGVDAAGYDIRVHARDHYLNIFNAQLGIKWYQEWDPKVRTLAQIGARYNINPTVKGADYTAHVQGYGAYSVQKIAYKSNRALEFTTDSLLAYAQAGLIFSLEKNVDLSVNYSGVYSSQTKSHTGFLELDYYWK